MERIEVKFKGEEIEKMVERGKRKGNAELLQRQSQSLSVPLWRP